MAVMDKQYFLSLLTPMQHLMPTVTMRDYWRKWQGCILNMSKWSNLSLDECSFNKVTGNVKFVSWQTVIFFFFWPIHHIQIHPKNGRIIMSLVQQHSSHHVHLHQTEQDGVKRWPIIATGEKLVVPEWRNVNPHMAAFVLGEIKMYQQLNKFWEFRASYLKISFVEWSSVEQSIIKVISKRPNTQFVPEIIQKILFKDRSNSS